MAEGRIGSWLLVAFVLVEWGVIAGCCPGRGFAAGPPDSPQQIMRWVADLDSDQFLARETATKRLVAAGFPAIEPLVARIANGNLETTSRGIHVLRELALSTDERVEESARAGLQKLAATLDTTAARRSIAVLRGLNELRQRRAIDELTRLGAKIGAGQVQFGAQFINSVLTIEIGAEWEGDQQDLRRLRWLVGVEHVKFSGMRVTDDWMKYLSTMSNLTTLTLKRTSVTEEGLASIRDLPKLQSFVIMYSPIGDRAIEHILTLKQAGYVKLYGTKITKEAAQRLKDTFGEKKVDYRLGGFLGVNCTAHPLGCEVSLVQPGTAAMDAGIESADVILKYGPRAVESFETLTSHISENAPGDEVKLELVRNVRLRRQGIDRTEDAKLGITGKSSPLGIEVLTVEPDSFIAQLELRPGDVITNCDEKRVRDLAQLEAVFKAAKIGERLNVDYVRAATLITKVVKLGEWD